MMPMTTTTMIPDFISVNWYLVVFLVVLGLLRWSNSPLLDLSLLRGALRRDAAYRSFPGPRGLPLIGSALEVDRSRPYETFHRWAREYGGVYLVRMFGKKILVLSSCEAIHEALVTRGHDFSDRPSMYYRSRFMSDGSQDIVSASPGPVWTALKRTVQREMKKYDPGYRRLESLTNLIIDDLLADFRRQAGRPYDPRDSFFTAILNVTFLFLIGDKLDRDDPRLAKTKTLIETVTEVMNVGGRGAELDYFPWLRFLGNRTYARILEAKRIREEIFAWMSEKVRRDLDEGNDNLGVIHGFEVLLREGKEKLTSTNVKLTMVNLLIGSVSSTHNYLYLFCELMAHYPRVQRRLREEIDGLLGGRPGPGSGSGSGRRASLSDQDRLHYVRASLVELLRFGSLSPVLIPHSTSADTRIAGRAVPADTTVFVNSRFVHHDPRLWDRPYEFRPERFLDEEGRFVSSDHPARRRLLSFGGGPRACPGKVLAVSRMFLVVVNVLQNFEIRRPEEEEGQEEEKEEEEEEKEGGGGGNGGDVGARPTPCDPRKFELGLVMRPLSYKARLIPRA